MVMSLTDYINKYGEESGTKRYYGMQKLLASRKETYKSHPYKRLTKEWFMWRYPEDGVTRWESFVNESKQSLENFIARYGQEEGERKYQETLSKKNTVAIKRQAEGEDAVTEWYKRSGDSHRARKKEMDTEEYNKWRATKSERQRKTKQERYGSKSKLELYIQKYGEEGPERYAQYLQKIFKSIGASQEAERMIKQIIYDNPWLSDYSLYYRDSNDLNKTEWFIADKSGVCFYDFCIKESKLILEYDGAKWHPTQEQVDNHGNEIMEITGISYKEKYQIDRAKRKKAESKGFKVFTVRSDYTQEQTQSIIKQFIEEAAANGRQ